MRKQKKKSKSRMFLAVMAAVLLAVLILLPQYADRPIITWIAVTGIAASFALLLVPLLPRLVRPVRSRQKKRAQNADSPEEISDLETLLWRQISFQITGKLKSAYPEATWDFTRRPSADRLLSGKTLRIRTFHTGSYNFAEVSLDAYGNLNLTMMTVEALFPYEKDTPLEPPMQVDPKSWYTLIGKPLLQNVIGDLQARGHQKLFINESGEIFILNGDTPEVKAAFEHFPPKKYWNALTDIFIHDELNAKETSDTLELSWMS